MVSVCWRLLCDIMLVIFIISTVLGVVTNTNQPKIRAAAKPRPFVRGANVKDYFRGDVFQAFADASQFENALLMFYAPWDRESREARAVRWEGGHVATRSVRCSLRIPPLRLYWAKGRILMIACN